MTPAEMLELRNQGATRIDLHPDGSLASVHFAPLPYQAPPRAKQPGEGLPPHDDEGDDGPPKRTRKEKLAGKHSGLRSKDLRAEWIKRTGADAPRPVKDRKA